MEETIEQMVQWTRDLCHLSFFSTAPVLLPFSIDLPEAPCPIDSLTQGLWIYPQDHPKRLADFWNCFRKYSPNGTRTTAYACLLHAKDKALETATEMAILSKLVERSFFVQYHLSRLAIETRLTLRQHELELLNFQLHTGLLALRIEQPELVLLGAKTLYKIHLYLHTLLKSFFEDSAMRIHEEYKTHQEELELHFKKLQENEPTSKHSPAKLSKFISKHLVFLCGYYRETEKVWKLNGRYQWDAEDVAKLTGLHDLLMRTFSQLCIPIRTL